MYEKKSRTSHEVRGLKCNYSSMFIVSGPSHLTRGAWIEMVDPDSFEPINAVAPHTRCVD